jgi:hypothetical protein
MSAPGNDLLPEESCAIDALQLASRALAHLVNTQPYSISHRTRRRIAEDMNRLQQEAYVLERGGKYLEQAGDEFWDHSVIAIEWEPFADSED